MRVGDKIKYIGDPHFLDKNKIYTVYYMRDEYICISELSKFVNSPLPMWESKYFISIRDVRRQKIKKIYEE